LALLDIAFDQELDVACDMAFYGPADYSLTTRLLRHLARQAPEFEFDSLRRLLRPDQFRQLMRAAMLHQVSAESAGPAERARFGDPKTSRAGHSQ